MRIVLLMVSALVVVGCDDDSTTGDECQDGERQNTICGPADEGYQVRLCFDGEWGAWSDCQYGACPDGDTQRRQCVGEEGTQTRTCEGGEWTDWGDCIADEPCSNGATDTIPCGHNNNGTATRTCEGGTWGSFSQCDDPDECTNGDRETQSCGEGLDEQVRTCADGQWGDWSDCEGGTCDSGETDEQPCGLNNRGSQSRTCEDGTWPAWGACDDPDECVDGASEDRNCGTDDLGTQERLCESGEWGEWGDCDERCPNGSRDPGEECDGSDFGDDDCTTYGFDTGTLSCRANCTVDLSGCSDFAAECTHHEDCAGHPDGELCIFFEGRCGECLSSEDCSGASEVCGVDFECVVPSDTVCDSSFTDRPYFFGGECVECLSDDHCLSVYRPYCHLGSHRCGECSSDDHCADDLLCNSDGNCSPCREDSDCDGELCVRESYCSSCDPDRCPADRPNCSGGECVECYASSQCPEDHGCQDGTCVFEAIECSSSECDDHALLDVCTDEGVCGECETTWDCWWVFGQTCHETLDICVQCNDDSGCWGSDRCTPEGECVECLTSDDCVDERWPGCNDNRCVGECVDDEDCTNPAEPVCFEQSHCVECADDSDCVGNPRGSTCSYYNECGECRDDDDCPDGEDCYGNECRPECDSYWNCELDLGTYICGEYPNNCGELFDCGECGNGGTCLGFDCICPDDSFDEEARNDTAATATDLGETPDAPDSEVNIRALSINSDEDVDWYTFQAVDAWDFGSPHVTVELTTGDDVDDWDSWYQVTVWFNCDSGTNAEASCDRGTVSPETTHGVGCASQGRHYAMIEFSSDCEGTMDDSVTGLIRVQKLERQGRCGTYNLNLTVH